MNHHTQKIPIQAFKISGEMFGIRSLFPMESNDRSLIFAILNDAKINICFSSTQLNQKQNEIFCLVDASSKEKVHSLVSENKRVRSNCSFFNGVCLLNLYPHRSDISVLAMAISALLSEKKTIHCLASSISTLSFVIDENEVGAVTRLMGRVFEVNQS